ncbi:hypothetical protein HBH98_184490 [Parastagonospora nodorum]|nr:hypothetical protein HBH51_161790 [Parastagonospora nodorum]KAH4340883.1 hypothetical protein HBH98_184490 [Parastagonospora nodorum]KAH4393690.1 hypothetical protein HBH97_031930 [Parastagonospora nodorum]KAH4423873.1 hypothetical protein HBH99_043650 [Parastagonospora nodorum]KAH4902940.1 hypothetical protein HBI80_127680 [Parastagonospora nodorum]
MTSSKSLHLSKGPFAYCTFGNGCCITEMLRPSVRSCNPESSQIEDMSRYIRTPHATSSEYLGKEPSKSQKLNLSCSSLTSPHIHFLEPERPIIAYVENTIGS